MNALTPTVASSVDEERGAYLEALVALRNGELEPTPLLPELRIARNVGALLSGQNPTHEPIAPRAVNILRLVADAPRER